MENNYTGIQHHEGLLGIRNHPAMYVGSTNKVSENHAPKALTQLAQEVLSNSVDEYVAGYGKEIYITIHKDNSITIIDNGRGLPKGVDKTFDDVYISTTKLHASGKFENGAYASTNTAGMHGIGLKAANALSKYLEIKAISHATTLKDDKKVLTGDLVSWRIKLCREEILEKEIYQTYKAKDLTKLDNFTYQLKNGEIIKTGTTVHFLPDNSPISDTDPRPTMESIEWVNSDLYPKLESTSFLNPGLKIVFKDERKDTEDGKTFTKEWNYENGIIDYVKRVSKDYDKLDILKEPISFESTFQLENDEYFTFNASINYVDDMISMVDSYANGLRTVDGGHHYDGFVQSMVKVMNDFAKNQKLLKGNEVLLQSDVLDGLLACITMGVPKSLIQFESQTKEKLGTTKAKEVATKITTEHLTNYLYDNIEIGKALITRMLESKHAREKAVESRKASKTNRNKKKGLSLELSTKLKPATSNNAEEKELILCEGDSASNMDRDIRTQGILALRGKITNLNKVKQAELEKIVKGNLEISTIVETIGAGYGKHFSIEEMKYNRIIIATDAETYPCLLRN